MKSTQILIFTDFGWRGPYLGQMLSVLKAECPETEAVVIQSDAPSMDPRRSAYLLPSLLAESPPDATWLCVVDPGVGSERKALAARLDGRWVVAPDNGLIAPTVKAATDVEAWSIDWRSDRMSDSFHGRDLFAPAAARLSMGKELAKTRVDPGEIVGSDWPDSLWEVIYVDGYGNAMTGVAGSQINQDQQLEIAGRVLSFARTFSEAPLGEPFWYVNSQGLIEIAVNCGRADEELGLSIGTPVKLH